MRILSVFPESEIEGKLLDLLLNALGSRDGEVWVVSPWFGDLEFSLAERGTYTPLLGASRERVLLSELLEFLARDNDVHVVHRPPHVLFQRGDLTRLLEVLETREVLASSPSLRSDPAVQRALAMLERETTRLVDGIRSHVATIEFGRKVQRLPRGRLYLNERLHAKLIVTPQGAIMGSANLTWSGLHRNDELAVVVTDDELTGRFREAARQITQRRFSQPFEEYELDRRLTKEDRAAMDALRRRPDAPPAALQFLTLCTAE